MDPRLRGEDKKEDIQTFYRFINLQETQDI
jgi:hypothetical protein